MKILALVGSYRKNGNTARMVALIEKELCAVAARRDEPLEIETLYLGHQDIGLCRGCRVCFNQDEEKCPLQDDLLAIKARIQEADGLILASPIYVDDVSGIVKNWIDRLAHVCHRPEFAGKCVYLVATTGSSPAGHALRTMQTATSCWGLYIVGQAGFKTGALMPQEEMIHRYQAQAARIAREFLAAIHEQRFLRPSFVSLMTFKIQQWSWQRANKESVDLRYWQAQGWTERNCKYYVEQKANPLKVALARLVGAAIAPLVT